MRSAFLLAVCAIGLSGAGAKPELLWPEGAPGAVGSEEKDKPTLTIYPAPPDKNSGTGVVVLPGGSYQNLADNHEGTQIAEWLNSLGISAFLLRYRHAPRYRNPAPLQDAQQAIRTVRSRAGEFGLRPGRLGIWGFSAGGHLAATAATKFDGPETRPDFAILAYPVIIFGEETTHARSQRNLLDENAPPDLVRSFSAEKNVTARTPPTFLFHTSEDTVVPPENSVAFYLALRRAGVPAELHIYEKGKHGVGLASTDPILSSWPGRLADWLRTRGLL